MSFSLILGAVLLAFAIYAVLVRGEPGPLYFRLLAAGVVLGAVAGLAILRLLPNDVGSPGRVITAVIFLWVAWIGIIAFGVQAVRRRVPSVAGVVNMGGGILATLAPVSGLILANWLQ